MDKFIISRIKIHYPDDDYTSKFLNAMEYDIVCEACRHKIVGYEPDDIAQELRFRLFTQIGKYNPDMAGFRTWALRVIKNHILNLNTATKFHKRKINSNLIPLDDE